MGVFGTVMDVGHSPSPIACGVLAACFGYYVAFLGAAFALAIAAVLFWILVASRTNLLSCPAA